MSEQPYDKPGNRETWRTLFGDDSIVRWHFRSFSRKRTRIRGWVAESPGPDVLHVTACRQFARWLRSYGPPQHR